MQACSSSCFDNFLNLTLFHIVIIKSGTDNVISTIISKIRRQSWQNILITVIKNKLSSNIKIKLP